MSTLQEVAVAIAEFGPDLILVGLPINMDDSEGPRALAARAFGARLAERTNLPVDFHDERLSSFEADESLKGSGLTHKGKKKVQDADKAGKKRGDAKCIDSAAEAVGVASNAAEILKRSFNDPRGDNAPQPAQTAATSSTTAATSPTSAAVSTALLSRSQSTTTTRATTLFAPVLFSRFNVTIYQSWSVHIRW